MDAVDRAYKKAERVTREVNNFLADVIPMSIKEKYPSIKVETSIGRRRVTVTVLEKKYHWSSDIVRIYLDYPWDFTKREETREPVITYNYGSGGQRADEFSSFELLDVYADCFSVARNVVGRLEDSIQWITDKITEHNVLDRKASDLNTKIMKEKVDKQERKSEQVMAKAAQQFTRIRTFEELVTLTKLKNQNCVPHVKVATFNVYHDTFMIRLSTVQIDRWNKRTSYMIDNRRTSKKNLMAVIEKGMYIFDKNIGHMQTTLMNGRFKSVTDFNKKLKFVEVSTGQVS